jgi:thermostable 8-oxoguanine DNA glycosylase
MTTDDMLKVLAKVCIRATVVRVSVIVEDATLPPHSLTYVPYWTVDAGTEEIVVLKAYGMLYKELEYYCRDVEFERR